MGSFAALLATTMLACAKWRYAYVYASWAFLPCPRGRKRYVQVSLKTRFTIPFSDSSAGSQAKILPQKTSTLHVDCRYTQLISKARVLVLFGRWRSAVAA